MSTTADCKYIMYLKNICTNIRPDWSNDKSKELQKKFESTCCNIDECYIKCVKELKK